MAKKALDPRVKDMMEEIGAEIVERLGDQFFPIDGTPKQTCKMKEGSATPFKKVDLIAGHEFKPLLSYVGAREYLVMGFEPEDDQPFAHAEFTPKELDDYLPLFGPAVAKAFGLEGESFAATLNTLINRKIDELTASIEAEKQAAETAYTQNTNFGRF